MMKSTAAWALARKVSRDQGCWNSSPPTDEEVGGDELFSTIVDRNSKKMRLFSAFASVFLFVGTRVMNAEKAARSGDDG